MSPPPNGLRALRVILRKTHGWRREARRTANAISAGNGTSTPRTQARLTTKTITPEIADSAASTRIDASTVEVSVTPADFRSAIVRATGVHTPPGRYLASIE